ncbi:DNA adenine methylase [Rhodanobacter lindaniclasticus]
MNLALQLELDNLAEDGEDPAYLREQLITYIGNKRALLPFIRQGIETVKRRLGKQKLDVLDLFSGTGVVARSLKSQCAKLVANDLERYSETTNRCYLSNRSQVDVGELDARLRELNAAIAADMVPGVIAKLYAPADDERIRPGERAFYTRRNALYLDSARRAIAGVPEPLQAYFLAPLLSAASVHANTSGVFKGFYKSRDGIGQFGGHGKDALTRILKPIALQLPVLSRFECETHVTRMDANAFVDAGVHGHVDVAYIDPPYNQHPYGSNYFMLNLLCDYRVPTDISVVSGIPSDWNRSRYNQRAQAEAALMHVVDRCNADFLLLSYNSEGFIAHDRFLAQLRARGKLSVLETRYNTFRGSRNLNQRALHVTEFLYLLER